MKHLFMALALSLGLIAASHTQAQTPVPADAPAGSTGLCKDGTYTNAAAKKGACRGHKGVKTWYAAAGSAAAAPNSNAASATPPAAAAAPAEAPAGSTGLCKDGTYTNAAAKKGACRGHKGVKTWYAAAGGSTAAAASNGSAVNTTPPAAAAPAPAAHATTPTATAPAPGGGAGQVWVNSNTKTYHCPGDEWYGKTKHGSYMTEAAAIAAGNHASHGKACSK